ncbi:hypothetical protein ACS0TY_002992 [Phlomoides rotata]
MVYCKRGTIFVKSVDASDIVKDASTLCNLFVELVHWVGAKNIVHFVTDNGANYKAAGVLLNDKYPTIKWSPCAAHCLNLLLGDIGKMELVSGLAKRASLVTKFVYNHAFLLAWLRKREGWTEIVRPGPTRFATTFIALKSILEHQHDLQGFFTSRTFRDSRYYKDKKANAVLAVVLDSKFWSDCAIVVGVVAPLIRVLRIMDTDRRPSIGYVYDGIYRAKKAIKDVFSHKKKLYKPFTNIIKARWDKQLRRDIHAAAYLLNPAFAYDRENMCKKKEIMDGFIEMVTTLIGDKNEWWKFFGCGAPNLQNLVMKILSQTSSSSGCERNWSVFERIHTKKRNRLEHPRLNDLVFIHYNLRLQERLDRKRICYDPIDYESIDKMNFWVVEEEEETHPPIIDVDELNNMLYGEDGIPIIASDEDMDKIGNEVHHLEEIDDGDEERIVARMVEGDEGI